MTDAPRVATCNADLATSRSLKGIGASPGSVIGPAVVLLTPEIVMPDFEDPARAVDAAASKVATDLQDRSDRARASGRDEAADVLHAQSLMATDPMLADAVGQHLDQGLTTALDLAADDLSTMLSSLSDPYLAARADDVGEVIERLRRRLANIDDEPVTVDQPSVLLAERLTAAETAQLDPEHVLAFVTQDGGPTGHVAIIAQSLEIPAVVGVEGLMDAVGNGGEESPSIHTVAVDGSVGLVICEPDAAEIQDFKQRSKNRDALMSRVSKARGTSPTFDGTPVAVSANVGGPEDVARAKEEQADGIGLYRTEFLYIDRSEPPSEDEQYELYRDALQSFDETVVLRTFDLGGDKPPRFIELETEENPFLGVRGVRLYDQLDELLVTQIRAAVRAAPYGRLALMIPMISSADEYRKVRAKIDATIPGVGLGANLQTGIMVEVPSIALTARSVADEVDFFSIGTNDLTQYTMAADRTNTKMSASQDPLHPAVLRLCQATVEAGRPVSVCGQAATEPFAAAVFLGLGVTKLSVNASAVNLIKSTVAAQTPNLRAAVKEGLELSGSASEFRERLSSHVRLP